MTPFSKKLITWYHSRTRPMPWRGEKDPYRIWLSEVMLQQTQVETVIPYYERWIKKFPTLRHVAEASEDEVLKAWEGLGYYARVRNFRVACQTIVKDFKGIFPQNGPDFRKLKGVGPYTHAAVQSIAFKRPIPAIDGNVKRVVSRLCRIEKPVSQALFEVEAFLNKQLRGTDPGDFNQAMMDMGATLCRSKDPNCSSCPLQTGCLAYQKGDVHRFPYPEKKLIRPHYKVAVGIIERGDTILIGRRKSGGMLGGLWEFPGGKINKNEAAKACVIREIKEETGLFVKVTRSIGKIRHDYTHFSIEMEGFICRYQRGKVQPIGCGEYRWIRYEDISTYAFPKANHKLFSLLRG